ncbi:MULTISPECIES: flagellar protein FlaG [Alteromonas]|uniref:Flagellar biosynthesis protein FlaG n=1 Tax=Alteromonas stellipolaris TaxID=233316 RepID=A0AAW7Z2T7_9ALTE|nr:MULTISPECIES: flagellar protein FlaG [Alteromonas]AMJ90762.1 flagellar biosynthesis protein FlaG [Alteromonas sp. Mac2]ALM91496.1 Flagellin protein FlaG [Alteromonas stellipolaris LMG 21856]AMJ74468.1 flagellar biosynthesis protein FlaG [Alteromonas stellipolaris]AMJ86903.1 flagellar biosynthesis protein FlaG [Alteromonas sp. Mac1]ANB23304.1 flagellar biosynthesis protein FlaG [Alteromonas stellipolaris]
MEIVNNQTGQAFALASESATVSKVAPNESSGKASNDSENNSAGQQQANSSGTNTALKNGVSSVQNLAQGSGTLADKVSEEENQASLENAVQEVESFLQTQNRNLAFSIDDETKRSVVTVKDSESGDVIRQIPSEEVLALAERIQDLQQDVGDSVGVFINNRV